jgi:fluoroquinolone transport system ATP-binding protein
MASMILDARELGYTYPGADRSALSSLVFGVDEGEVFGFLGPNGSGKTTTQKLLTRILHGYSGSVEVFGRDLREHDDGYYNAVGVCFEFPNLYEKLTAEENLNFYRAFFDTPTDEAGVVLERLDLPVADKRNVGQWSKGMKMRLTLARSLLNRPQLWFLDEPTTGQDPQHAVLIRKLIRERARAGTSIFLTTHDMTVADELCDRVAFLVDGRIVLVDTPRRLKLAHARKVARVEYRDGGEIRHRDFDLDVAREKRSFLELVDGGDVLTIHTQEPSLEDVFLEVTGRALLG